MFSTKISSRCKSYIHSFSFVGLFIASLFFATSLTPSLIPRHFVVQGLLSGFSLAVGYGVGVFLVAFWKYLELPLFPQKRKKIAMILLFLASFFLSFGFLWNVVKWQNSIRDLMGMDLVNSANTIYILLVALLFSAFLVAMIRWAWIFLSFLSRYMGRLIPRRIANTIGVFLGIFLLFSLVDNLLMKNLLTVADNTFSQLDSLVEEDIPQPEDSLKSGSKNSLISWEGIGRRGKHFIATGPTKKDISTFTGRFAQEPLRVYAGFNSAETPEARAKLALEELKRISAFDRSILVIAVPTGTGWMQEEGVDPIEYLHDGDTVIVTTQYSYLPSWMTLLIDPDRSIISAKALFNEVYDHWKTLPEDQRPKLYLHGLSLGALGSESSSSLYRMIDDPIDGAMWSGTPFPSEVWKSVTRSRNLGSPEWLPQFEDGSLIRFTGRDNALNIPGAVWGGVRIVYLQYPSDPMVFFSPSLLYKEPDWLQGKRGDDVSPYLDWYPVITFLQVGFDLLTSTSVPAGHGHNYAVENYIESWIEVSHPQKWSSKDVQRLKDLFLEKAKEKEKEKK